MNKPIQAMADQEQQWPPPLSERVDYLVKALMSGEMLDTYAVALIADHINLLRRQAVKAGNQRKALKAINRAQRMIQLELRWLWGLMKNAGANPPTPTTEFSSLFERSKATLWDQFRREIRHSDTAQIQVDRLASFILAEVPGEPSRSEGAVDTAIRWMKNVKNIHGSDPLDLPLLIDLKDHSFQEVVEQGAAMELTGPGGEPIFEGTWNQLKSTLRAGRDRPHRWVKQDGTQGDGLDDGDVCSVCQDSARDKFRWCPGAPEHPQDEPGVPGDESDITEP